MLEPHAILARIDMRRLTDPGSVVVSECCHQWTGTDLVIGAFGRKANNLPQNFEIFVVECLLGNDIRGNEPRMGS